MHEKKNSRDYLKDPGKKLSYTKNLFTKIAPRYDLITRLLSFNQDIYWKSQLINLLPELSQPTCLDLACGTGDLTQALAKKYPEGQIIGLDLTPQMLEIANAKNCQKNIAFICCDMSQTNLDQNSVDIVTGGYALRNASSLEDTLKEISRVLKKNGTAIFLEFTRPTNSTKWKIQNRLLKLWGKLWGFLIHCDPSTYSYIAESNKVYPNASEFKNLCTRAELKEIYSKSFMFGFTEIIVLKKF